MSNIMVGIIGFSVCAIPLIIIKIKESLNRTSQPPKGWMKHKGRYIKMYDPNENINKEKRYGKDKIK